MRLHPKIKFLCRPVSLSSFEEWNESSDSLLDDSLIDENT